MSVDVRAAQLSAVARPPCSPITNEEQAIRKKPSFSLASFMPKRPSSTTSNHTSSADSAAAKQKKAKKPAVDLAATYGADFARAVAANQFLNGGSVDDAIARVKRDNEKMARRRAEKYGVPYVPDATAPVRGPNGELFRDAQDETEHRGLIRNAYKGMAEPTQSTSSRPSAAAASTSSRQRSSTVNARADFFASSFAPPVPPVPTRRV